MEDEKMFDRFFGLMRRAIEQHKAIYDNSWKVVDKDFLENRIKNKFDEYKLTRNPNKLISATNLIMMLHIKSTIKEYENDKTVY